MNEDPTWRLDAVSSCRLPVGFRSTSFGFRETDAKLRARARSPSQSIAGTRAAPAVPELQTFARVRLVPVSSHGLAVARCSSRRFAVQSEADSVSTLLQSPLPALAGQWESGVAGPWPAPCPAPCPCPCPCPIPCPCPRPRPIARGSPRLRTAGTKTPFLISPRPKT